MNYNIQQFAHIQFIIFMNNSNRSNFYFPQVNPVNCVILQSKNSLKYFPSHCTIYYINSKRRFFVYFKNRNHMNETIKILNEMKVKYQKRESLIPDREQYQQQVFHCNFKFKRIDLRKNLAYNTPYNQPKVIYDQEISQRAKANLLMKIAAGQEMQRQNYKNGQKLNDQTIPDASQFMKIGSEKVQRSGVGLSVSNERKFKNEQVKGILEDRELIRDILKSMEDLSKGQYE